MTVWWWVLTVSVGMNGLAIGFCLLAYGGPWGRLLLVITVGCSVIAVIAVVIWGSLLLAMSGLYFIAGLFGGRTWYARVFDNDDDEDEDDDGDDPPPEPPEIPPGPPGFQMEWDVTERELVMVG